MPRARQRAPGASHIGSRTALLAPAVEAEAPHAHRGRHEGPGVAPPRGDGLALRASSPSQRASPSRKLSVKRRLPDGARDLAVLDEEAAVAREAGHHGAARLEQAVDVVQPAHVEAALDAGEELVDARRRCPRRSASAVAPDAAGATPAPGAARCPSTPRPRARRRCGRRGPRARRPRSTSGHAPAPRPLAVERGAEAEVRIVESGSSTRSMPSPVMRSPRRPAMRARPLLHLGRAERDGGEPLEQLGHRLGLHHDVVGARVERRGLARRACTTRMARSVSSRERAAPRRRGAPARRSPPRRPRPASRAPTPEARDRRVVRARAPARRRDAPAPRASSRASPR